MKRKAESELLWEVPQKCFRSLSNEEMQFAAVQVIQSSSEPPSYNTLIGQTGQPRRKRPNCSEDHESKDVLSPQKKVLSNNTTESVDATENLSTSGKFQEASKMLVPQPSHPHEFASKRSKKESKTEHLTKVMHADVDDVGDGDLCIFNSFQFWRTPLPELDLSILDGQYASEINEHSFLKDPIEAMET